MRKVARKDRSGQRKWAKRKSKLWLKKKELKAKIAKTKKKLGPAGVKAKKARKRAKELTKKATKAKTKAGQATRKVSKSKAKVMTNTGKKQLKLATDANAAKAVAAAASSKALKEVQAAKAARAQSTAVNALVNMEQKKLKELRSEVKSTKKKSVRVKKLLTMFSEKVSASTMMVKRQTRLAHRYRREFQMSVQSSLRIPTRIEVTSATIICPGIAVDKNTNKPLPRSKLWTKELGKQTSTLRKACNGFARCKYLVDTSKILSAPCGHFAYRVRFRCVPGKLRAQPKLPPQSKRKGKRKKKKAKITSGKKTANANNKASKRKVGQATKKTQQVKKSTAKKGTKNKVVFLQLQEEKISRAQKAAIRLTKDMTKLKAVVGSSSNSIKSKMKNVSTSAGLRAAQDQLSRLLNSGRRRKRRKSLSFAVEIPSGPNRRFLKFACHQPQVKSIARAERALQEARAARLTGKRALRKAARKVVRKAERKASKLKRLVKKDKKKAVVEKTKVVKDKTKDSADKLKASALKMAIKKAPSKGAKAKLKAKMKKVLKADLKVEAKMAKAAGKAKTAKAKAKIAKRKARKVLRKVKPAAPKLKLPRKIRRADKKVRAKKVQLRATKKSLRSNMKLLRNAKSGFEAMALEKKLAAILKQKLKFKQAVRKAQRKREEKVLHVSHRVKRLQKKKLIKEDKMLVKAQDKANALKLQLKTAKSPKKAAIVQQQLKRAKKKVQTAKGKVLKTQFAPVVKEVGVVTKIEKSRLVKLKKKSLKKVKNKKKVTKAELASVVKLLKKTTNPQLVSRLAARIMHLRKTLGREKKKIVKKENKVLKAKKIKASPTRALKNLAKNAIEEAKKKILKLKAAIRSTQAQIVKTSEPTKAKKYMLEMLRFKKDIRRQQRAIARRNARVTKIRKLKSVPKKPKAKKITKVALLSQTSKKVAADEKIVDRAAERVKIAKAAFAASINAVLRAKEGKEKGRVQAAKQGVRITKRFLKRTKKRSAEIRKQAKIENKTANYLKKIKHGFVSGRYHLAYKAQRSHLGFTKRKGKKKKVSQRSVAAKATARRVYAIPSSKSGVCSKGKCCLTSFTDGKCKKKRAAMCVAASSKPLVQKWKPVIRIKTTFIRKVDVNLAANCTSNCSVSYKRTMHVEAQWSPLKVRKKQKGQVLRLRVCGKFTKFGSKGAIACYPKKGKGFSLGRVFAAPAGSCIRTSDFAAVSKDRLKRQVRRLIASLKRKNVMKKAKLKDKLRNLRKSKTTQVGRITKAVSRAIGGVFKGRMGGISRLGEVHGSDNLVDFIDEDVSIENFRKQLLADGGSFMLTAVAPVTKKEKQKGKVPTVPQNVRVKKRKSSKKARLEAGTEFATDTEVVEIS